jgi:hypothetical protein
MHFSVFSLISGMAWAGLLILALVAWGGPSVINLLVLENGGVPFFCQLASIVAFFYWIGRTSKKAIIPVLIPMGNERRSSIWWVKVSVATFVRLRLAFATKTVSIHLYPKIP